jgi:hypothetical protein
MAQAPLIVFANQRPDIPQTLEILLGGIGKSIQNEVSQKEIRTSLVERRIQEAEKQHKQEQTRTDTSLAALQKQVSPNTVQQTLVSKSFDASKVKIEELLKEVGDRVKSFEKRSREYLEEVEASIASSKTEYKAEFDRMADLLDRNDLRNMKKIDKIADSVEESQKGIEDRDAQLNEEIVNLKEINEGQNVTISELERKVNGKAKHLEDMIESQNNQIQALQSQIRESIQEARKCQETAEAQSNEIRALRSTISQSSEQVKSSKEIIDSHSEKIYSLERQLKEKMESFTKRIEAQEIIYELESQSQLLKDARRQHEQAMTDQIEAHLQQTAKQISTMKEESVEQALRIQRLEQTNTEQSENIQSLVDWVKKFEQTRDERDKILDLRETDRLTLKRGTSEQLKKLTRVTKE